MTANAKTMALVCLACVLLSGCTRSPKPLVDHDVQLMSNSRYALAYIDYHGKPFQQIMLKSDEYDIMRSLINALSPVRSSEPGQIDDPDYSLTYQGGMDPTTIDVRIRDGVLEYGLRNFIHSGGDPEKFQKLLPDPQAFKR